MDAKGSAMVLYRMVGNFHGYDFSWFGELRQFRGFIFSWLL